MNPEQVQETNKVEDDQKEGDTMNFSCTRVCYSTPSMGCSIGDKTHRRRYLVNFLVMIFGIGATISVNGVGAEMPLLVRSAPEGSVLPVNAGLAVVAACVGPALYAILNGSASPLKIRNEFTWISTVLILGTISMGLLAFFYNVTTTINAVDHSLVMIMLVFMLASVSNLRNVLLMPYLRKFEDAHLTSFFIGEGLSGFLPSVVALIQGVGGDPVCQNNSTNPPVPYIPPPNFSPRDYFLSILAIMICSICAFWLLEYLSTQTSSKRKDAEFSHDHVSAKERDTSAKLLNHESTEKACAIGIIDAADLTPTTPPVVSGSSISNIHKFYLCVMMFLVASIAHGYLNVMETYSSRPYGDSAYHLVVNLSQLGGTTACVLGFWLPPPGVRGITVIVGFVCAGATYVTWLSLCSPIPPWRDTTHGVILLVTIWVLLMSLVFYVKLAITAIVWRETSDAGLYLLGFAVLVGSFCGCTVVFSLVNFTTLFTPYTPCELQ